MKKLINAPDDVVDEALAGMVAAHGDLIRVDRAERRRPRGCAAGQGKVGVISGGGSGPRADARRLRRAWACSTRPARVPSSRRRCPDQMLAATKAVDGGAGVLHIVKNYTGDIMNFELAAELAQAEGIEVTSVVIADDVAVQDSLYTAGRRGVGGTVLAEKIVGAAAEGGADLATVTALCQRVQDNVRSHGHGPHQLHGAGRRQADLRDRRRRDGDRHRHPRRARTRRACKLATADEIAEMLAGRRSSTTCGFERGDSVLAFVNGMGGTPLIELYIVYNKVAQILEDRGITIGRNLVGNYITSLEMAGCSITLLKLDDEMIRLWDAPVHTAGSALGRLNGFDERLRRPPTFTRFVDDLRGPDPRAPGRAHRARLGDRRRRPRDQHGPRLHRGASPSSAGSPDADARGAAQGRRHDADLHGRWGSGPLYGTFFLRLGPPRAGETRRLDTTDLARRPAGRPRRSPGRAERPSSATRRWSMR